MKLSILISTIIFLASANLLSAQETEKKTDSGFQFTIFKQVGATPVKNQYRSSTCWSYSAISFLESELLRMGKDTFNLSEMFCVRNSYSDKAIMYIRFQGKHNFSSGGAFHDVTDVFIKYGMIPEEFYNGNMIGEVNPVHGEVDGVLSAYVEAVLKNPNRKLTPVWHQGFDGILDAYLGKVPEKFSYKGKDYSPKSFAESLGLNMDDYVEVSSFIHHPFFTKFIIEIPDNWALGEVYNIPLDDMIRVIDNSLENGYSVAWGSDISEKGFSWKNGVALVPDKNAIEIAGLERAKWEKMSDADKEKLLFKFDKPVPERIVTQEMRQLEFDNYQTTDDHGMHIIGVAKDQNGTKYYLVKNSWGLEGSPYKGYFYASEAFVKLKTTDIMVHKNAIPKDLTKKLGL
jgi:bleomycin hydrolase